MTASVTKTKKEEEEGGVNTSTSTHLTEGSRSSSINLWEVDCHLSLSHSLNTSAGRLLEDRDGLKEKNDMIEELKESMTRLETKHQGRVLMLEMEIDRLIELRMNNVESKDIISPTTLHNIKDKTSLTDIELANIEISSLNELLVKIIAERDVFSMKIRNIEKLMKENSSRRKIDKGELTCKKCKGGEEHCTVGKTSKALKVKIREYVSEVCDMVNETKKQSNKKEVISTDSAFSRSLFAEHIAEHCCKDTTSDDEILKFFQKNIKVEIIRIELDDED